jgi:hypothetical protein
MKVDLKHEASRVSTWGIILTGIAAVAPYVPALAPFLPPPVVPVLLIATAIAKAVQGPATQKEGN